MSREGGMSSEGGGMGSERGQIRDEGGGRELVGGALVAIRGGRRWCRLVVVGCPCCPLVPCCRSFVVVRSFSSFVRVRRSSVLRCWRLASLSWEGVK